MSFIETKIREIVREATKRRDPNYLTANLKKIFDRYAITDSFKEGLKNGALKQYDYLSSKSLSPEERRMVGGLYDRAAKDFLRTLDGENRDLNTRIANALRQDKTEKEIRNLTEHIIGKQRNLARTISNTAMAAFDNVSRIVEANQAGLDEWTYYGPPAERDFCANLMRQASQGKTWTMAEIRKMSNGQGLPVPEYCGGYNCTHHFMIVTKI